MNYKKSLKKLKKYHYSWWNVMFIVLLFPFVLLMSLICSIAFVPYLFKYTREGNYKGVAFNSYEHLLLDLKEKNMTGFNIKKEQIREFVIGATKEQISALVVRNKNSKKWVIGLHGFKRNKYMGLRNVYHFYDQGYNILCFDGYAHGSTYGKYSDFGLTNAKVLNDVLIWLKNAYEIEEIGVLGTSMGATTSLFFAKKYYEDNKVDWLISDCPFTQAVPQIRFFLQKYLIIPWWFMSLGINRNFRKFAKTNIKDVDLLKGANNISDLKILFIHGKKDDFIMYHNTIVLYHLKHRAEVVKQSDLKLYENAKHSASMHNNLDDYSDTTINFIKS